MVNTGLRIAMFSLMLNLVIFGYMMEINAESGPNLAFNWGYNRSEFNTTSMSNALTGLGITLPTSINSSANIIENNSALNQQVSNITDTGLGWISTTVYSAFGVLAFIRNAMAFGLNFLFAPWNLMNMLEAPFMIKVVFGIGLTILNIFSVLILIMGREW